MCIWISDQVVFFWVAITGQVFGNTVITVRLSLINQRSAMVYVIFSLAMKWHENSTLCQTYSVENRKKGSHDEAIMNEACP